MVAHSFLAVNNYFKGYVGLLRDAMDGAVDAVNRFLGYPM
jgi:hypothetical protein